MAKWHWSAAFVAALGVGTTGTVYWKCASSAPTCCITSVRPVPAPVTSTETPQSATLIKPNAAQPLPVIRDDVDEPIVTRSEPLEETPTVNSLESAWTAGGMKECDATSVLAPRPDHDPRRMPYADNVARGAVQTALIWLTPPGPGTVFAGGLIIPIALAKSASSPPDVVEESEEPPVLEDALPPYYHPPHCPYGGQCPYPSSSYRTVVPR
jgi:hypothetical protein